MKVFFKILISLLIIVLLLFAFFEFNHFINKSKMPDDNITSETTPVSNEPSEEEIANMKVTDFSVSNNGWLSVNGSSLVNNKHQKIQLTGVSSHGIQWFYDVLSSSNLDYLKNEWKINVFRIAMYSDAYVANPDEIKLKLTTLVDEAIDLDMYVIIDWHILSDNDPNIYIDQSNAFFNAMSLKYKDCPNVIYEICNEPNGNEVSWRGYVKPYAEKIIPTIRSNSPDSLVIVGTPDYCKKLKQVADDPLDFENIAYSCHFYAGSHGQELRDEIKYVLDKNLCVFVSECGSTDYTGNGNNDYDSFSTWINFLNENNISWIYWSFANKNEGASLIQSTYDPLNEAMNVDDYLTDFGIFLKKMFIDNYNNLQN